jgi:hypothetical protein
MKAARKDTNGLAVPSLETMINNPPTFYPKPSSLRESDSQVRAIISSRKKNSSGSTAP